MKKFIFALWALTASVLFTGCNRNAGDVIRVGEFASLSGKEATFGESSHNGTQLAIDELNAGGGVLGKKLELVTEDDRSQAGEPATVVRKLISRDKVVAVLGEVASSRSLEAAPICQESKIPMISPASTNPKVTETGDYIFRVCFIDPFQGTVMANFARKSLKLSNVAILSDVKSDYSVGLARFFKERFTQDGGKIATETHFSGGDKDFKAQLTTIKGSNPDGIFVPGYYTDVGLIVQQARQLGLAIPLFGGDGWESSELVKIGGAAMEGTYFSTHYSPESTEPKVQEFVRKYKAKHKSTPDAMAALGYDSAMILADAMKRAGATDAAKVRDAMAATKDFNGVTGKITIDTNRNATKPAVILTVTKDGKFKYVETVSP
jgi:branched-chain amino acid transport system substrate-binding protein